LTTWSEQERSDCLAAAGIAMVESSRFAPVLKWSNTPTMFAQLFFFIFLLLVFAVLALKSLVTIKEGEYAAIFRLGKLLRLSGPGAIIIIPFIDRVIRVPVDHIVGWQTMPREELDKKVVDIALRM